MFEINVVADFSLRSFFAGQSLRLQTSFDLNIHFFQNVLFIFNNNKQPVLFMQSIEAALAMSPESEPELAPMIAKEPGIKFIIATAPGKVIFKIVLEAANLDLTELNQAKNDAIELVCGSLDAQGYKAIFDEKTDSYSISCSLKDFDLCKEMVITTINCSNYSVVEQEEKELNPLKSISAPPAALTADLCPEKKTSLSAPPVMMDHYPEEKFSALFSAFEKIKISEKQKQAISAAYQYKKKTIWPYNRQLSDYKFAQYTSALGFIEKAEKFSQIVKALIEAIDLGRKSEEARGKKFVTGERSGKDFEEANFTALNKALELLREQGINIGDFKDLRQFYHDKGRLVDFEVLATTTSPTIHK